MNQTINSVTTSVPVKTQPSVAPDAFVQPSELCDTQRRSMAYDAFAALQAHGC